MLIAALGLYGMIQERKNRDAKADALVTSKVDQSYEMITELKDMVSRLLDGYNSNDKRISMLEDRYKNLSGRVVDLEKQSRQ